VQCTPVVVRDFPLHTLLSIGLVVYALVKVGARGWRFEFASRVRVAGARVPSVLCKVRLAKLIVEGTLLGRREGAETGDSLARREEG